MRLGVAEIASNEDDSMLVSVAERVDSFGSMEVSSISLVGVGSNVMVEDSEKMEE